MDENAQNSPNVNQQGIPVQPENQLPKRNPQILIIFISIMLIFLLATAGVLGFSIYRKNNNQVEAPSTSAGINLSSTPAPPKNLLPTNPMNENSADGSSSGLTTDWQIYTHEPFTNVSGWDNYRWVGFKLYYPSGWDIIRSDRDESKATLNLEVAKSDGSKVQIIQGFSEGGRCLFPDDSDYETFDGMGEQFAEYIQIDKSDGEYWRLAEYPAPGLDWTHNLCVSTTGNKDSYFSNASNIGFSKINLVDGTAVNEFVEMLQKVESIYATGE